MSGAVLPAGFEALEPFVGYWAVAGVQERRERRENAPMEDIETFYNAMLALAPQAIAHLEGRQMVDLEGADRTLMELLLALAHASMATELHRQPRAPFTPWPHEVRLVEAPAIFG
ncbi:hypothetical protein [Novosphingobium colocasiae]|uniref:hypothetical protein n=1 Tax=Novosphingobium colocasiae TaxID=1256513 RepID=UPI0035AE3E84